MGSKPKNVPEIETADTRESIEELSAIFSTANFQVDPENTNHQAVDDDDLQLDLGMDMTNIIQCSK